MLAWIRVMGAGFIGAMLMQCAWSAEVQVAVAANFAATMKRLAPAFERATGHQAALIFGSTGQLDAQIRNGAPFDVLLAADAQSPLKLEQDGLTVPGSRFTYASGRLVLWSRQPDWVDAQGEVLRRGGFKHLAIAQPALAPYGGAAMDVLERLGMIEALRPRLVYAANVAQAHQFIASGNAALGFIAMSQVFENGQIKEGSAWVVPAAMHRPLRQDAVLLKKGQDNPAAIALMLYLKGDWARAQMRSFGYESGRGN